MRGVRSIYSAEVQGPIEAELTNDHSIAILAQFSGENVSGMPVTRVSELFVDDGAVDQVEHQVHQPHVKPLAKYLIGSSTWPRLPRVKVLLKDPGPVSA